MSPSVAVSIMRYAAKNGASAAKDKYGSVMYNNALGQAKAKGATGDMIRKSLQSIAKKSDDAAKNIPKAVRDLMLPKGTKDLPKKPGSQIPQRVKDKMVSKEQDAKNKGDSKLKTENRKPKVTKSGVEQSIKSATDKAGSAVKTASRVGKLAKGMTGVGAALTASEVGAGSDVVPAGRRNEFVDKYKRGRGDGAAEVKARKAEAERKKKEKAKAKTESSKKGGTYKIKKGDTLSEIAQRKGTTVKALMDKNPQIKDKDKIYAGRSLKLNQGGVVKANCGASMKPTQKSSRKVN